MAPGMAGDVAGNEVTVALRLIRVSELAAAAVLAVAPALLPPRAWPVTGPHRWLGVSLLCLAAVRFVSRRWITGSRPEAPGRVVRLTAGDVVLLVAMPVYVLAFGSARGHTSGDNAATTLLGPLIVRQGTIDLSRLPEYQTEPLHYSATRVGDRILPTYPLGTALLYGPLRGGGPRRVRGRMATATRQPVGETPLGPAGRDGDGIPLPGGPGGRRTARGAGGDLRVRLRDDRLHLDEPGPVVDDR